MSKKKIYNKHLEKGKFYIVNKHPGLIVLKNDKKNIYIAVITGTSQHRHQTKTGQFKANESILGLGN